MDDLVKKLGTQHGLALISEFMHRYAQLIVNPAVYDPMKKKYQSRLHTGVSAESASAAMPKVLPAIQT
jgi:hypothetical protein